MVSFSKKINVLLFSFLLILFCHNTVSAEPEILFQIKPDSILYFKEGQIFSAWNPKKHPEIRTAGLKIFFFGKPEGCLPNAQNGPVKMDKSDDRVEKLVGLPVTPQGKIYLPIQDKKLCEVKDNLKEGGSFVYINEHPNTGGIGLFTASGIDEKGEPYFFQTRDEEGVGGGINKYLKSTAITWRLEKESIYPFKDKSNLKIYIKSSVVNIPQVKNRSMPVQVRQQIEIGFANKACLNKKSEDQILCLNKFVFDVFVKRWGGKPIDMRRSALIFIDKAQGGLPHISCFSKPAGEIIKERDSGLEVALSCGEGLQQDTFKDKNFCYKISWKQFQNALLAIATKILNKKPENINREEMEKLFGKDFDNPNDWYLTVISFQHELHDPYKDKNIFIGGNVKRIEIIRE